MHRNMTDRLAIIISLIASMLIFGTLYGQVLVFEVIRPSPAFQPHPPSRKMSSDRELDAKLNYAETLWQQSVDDRRIMVEEVGSNRDFPDAYIYPYHAWDFVRPSFFCPHDLERVGTIGDGGKVVCGMSRYDSSHSSRKSDENSKSNGNGADDELIVYSFGMSGGSAFEIGLLERTNARVWEYDYSVTSSVEQINDKWLPRASFSKMGISGQTNLQAKTPISTIQDMMKVNGHTYIDIVKMDIEGAEFDALSSLVEYTKELAREKGEEQAVLPIGQLLVDIHFRKPSQGSSIPSDLATWLEWWSSLEELGLRAVSNEDDWIRNLRFGKSRSMEYTMINVLDQRNKLLSM